MTSLNRLVLAASAAALLTACGDRADVNQQPDANPAATIPTPANETAAPTFVEMAAASDMYEIQAADIALERSQNAQVREFATMMKADHSQSTDAVKAAVASAGLSIAPPAALPQDKMAMIQALRDAPAADFDRTYMGQQVDAHQSALNLMQRYANDGDTEALKTTAAAIAPVVQRHLDRANQIRDGLPQ